MIEELVKRAARDLVRARYAIALTGAGVSTESGIPDFRGPSGIWTKNPEAERRAYRSYDEFLANPKQWWETSLARSRPGAFGNLEAVMPNPGHLALAELERMGILRCLITQNVDGLHERAGSTHLLEYHGNMTKLRCVSCGARYHRDAIDLERLRRENRLPPECPSCQGLLKTDGVFFGEPIPSDVAYRSQEEAEKCDLVLICGTSAVVYPFASLPRIARQRRGVTIIELNAEPTPLTEDGVSDYLIQGRTGEILPRMVDEVKTLRTQAR